jgi:hypothetical protein
VVLASFQDRAAGFPPVDYVDCSSATAVPTKERPRDRVTGAKVGADLAAGDFATRETNARVCQSFPEETSARRRPLGLPASMRRKPSWVTIGP